MWLTDFIPGAESGIEVPCKLLGSVSLSGGNAAVPTPACAQDGDYQVVVWTYFTNGSPTWASTDWGTAPGQWKTAAWFAGNNRPAVSFRKITTANLGQPFRIYQPSGALTVSYATFIMRNIVSDIDPIMSTVTNATNSLSSSSNISAIDHPGHVPLSAPSDIVIACLSETSFNGNAQMQVPTEDGVGVLSSGTTTRQSFAAGDAPNTAYAVTRLGGLGSIVNMNGSTTDDPLNGWTLSQVERVAGNQGVATTYSVRELALGATGTRYGIYKNFNFTAGKRYVFSIDTAFLGGAGSGTSRSAPWWLVTPPSGIANQYGCCWNVQFSVFQQVGGLSGTNWMFRHGSTLGSGMWTATFIAAETGVHTLWFGILTSGAAATFPSSLATHSGSTARVYNGNHITVTEAVTTAVTEVAPYNGLMERLPSSGLYYPSNRTRVAAIYNPYTSGGGSSQFFVTARNGSAKRPLARVQLQSHPRVINAPNNGRTIAAQYTGGLNPGGSFIRYSDHLVGAWIATKFYFEITVTTVGTGAIGYAVSSRLREWWSATFPGAGDGDFGYLTGVASGRTYVTQGSTTGLSPWAVGDVIGCLLDYTTSSNIRVYFTRNGVPYANSAFPSGAPWLVVGAKVFATDAIDGVASTLQFTSNLTGPFYFKPADAVAFDFDNEVGGTLSNDPQFGQVVLLLRGEGSNGSTSILDRSGYARTVTRNGGTQMDTAKTRNGRPSIRIGPTNDWLRVADAAEFDLNTKDWTFEAWCWWDSFPSGAGGLADAMQNSQNWPASSWEIYFPGSGMNFSVWSSSASGGTLGTADNPPTGQWVHVCIQRLNGIFYLYYNGVQKATLNWTGSVMNNGTEPLYIGGFQLYNQTNTMNGWINELRWTVGGPRYNPAGFSPPSVDFPLS